MSQSEINSGEFFLVKTGKIIEKDFFYIPIFYHKVDQDVDWVWYSLRFNGSITPGPMPAYASKVNAGDSLKNAIIRDLSKDFKYPQDKTFVIDDMKIHDTAMNKRGEDLTRLIAIIGLDEKIDVSDIHPFGINLQWQEEGENSYNLIKDHFSGLSEDLYHTQSYVHIPMDDSSPADPAAGKRDEYIFPDGSRDNGSTPIWF